ncbi:AMP-binding protein [Microvirga antarctica]|uniref:AMP-binding protein n=1 Tax=Microvirga antarctica TaxID=2819233 RepID=UPI001B3177EB|nr:AMP-binding protein [Microvirga antarctica]
MPTPYASFARTVVASPGTIFLRAPASAQLAYAPEGFEISYEEAARAVEAVRLSYAAAGYGHGVTVALLLENRPVFFWHWLALNALGVAILPINPDLRADDLAYQFTIAEPDLVVALPEREPFIRSTGMDATRIVGPDGPFPTCRLTTVRSTGGPDDACALLFTSGTTGNPKCCVLSNDYFMQLARWYVGQGGIAEMKLGKEVILTPLPFFHMNALGCSALGAILMQATLVPLDRFHASTWWRAVADSHATVMHYLGVMPAILLKLATTDTERSHRVRFAFGAGVDPRHQAIFEERFGIPLVEAWAMTETGGGAVTSTAGGERHVGERCIGYPRASMNFRIVNENGEDASAGEAGELLVRSAGAAPRKGFFTQYLKDPLATAQAWAGGWFQTGDVVRQGADGALFFVDRKKNIVRRSGENIAVVEVEGVLQNLEPVAGVAVAPVPDDIRGEEVFALVKLHDGKPATLEDANRTAEALARACGEQLAYYKVPGFIAFVDHLPITATQKLQRAEIRRLAEGALGDSGTVDLRTLKAQLRLTASA